MSRKIKKAKKTKRTKKGYKRGSLGQAIYKLFTTKGVDNVLYEESLKLAKSILPTTKYNKSHFSWYKNKFRQMQLDKKKKTKKNKK